ncbi:MAG: hypothetical protein H6656_21160 [Ardenticatenaceae bacterium]|nr:hypothetical protein [Ardenticatenaceae bacterium]
MTIGYTPQLVTGVWIGNSDNSPMQNVRPKGSSPHLAHALMSWPCRMNR